MYIVVWVLSWNALGILLVSEITVGPLFLWLLIIDLVILALALLASGATRSPTLRSIVLRADASVSELRPSLLFVSYLGYLCAAAGFIAAWRISG